VQQFADRQVGDVKCAFNMVDDNLKNFCSFWLSLSTDGW